MNSTEVKISKLVKPYLVQNRQVLTELPEKEIALLEKQAVEEFHKRGKILFRQNGYPKGVYWLISGKIKIYQETASGQRQTNYIYSNGDLIGYRQFIANEPHPVSAKFLEDSVVKFIPGELIRKLLESSPVFARHMLMALAREFTVWMNRMTVYSTSPVKQRVVLALLILFEQYRLSGSKNGNITITRTELAEFVGASLETVVRILNKLKTDEMLEVKGRVIVLSDPAGLIQVLKK